MKYLKPIIEKQDSSFEDEMENITSVIRKMARTQGFIDSFVSVGDDNIILEIVLEKEETFNKVIQMLDFVNKIQKDILSDFKCDMDLWETKKNAPIFTFEFYYSTTSSAPKYDYDDNFPF
jgi:uncharacterized protein YihD (DUF1040 family)